MSHTKKYKAYSIKDAEYLANIENLDRAIGRLIEFLKENQLIDNTLIIFSSDNGSYRQASNGNLRAVKSYLYDGGIRVPGIIHWPALKKTNVVVNEAAGFVDIMPTICDILQIQVPGHEDMDGTSILNLLKSESFTRKKPLFWYFYRTSPEIAMRINNFMILGKDRDTIPRTHRFSAQDMSYIKEMNLTDYEMYDLSKDIHQDENIIHNNPNANEYKKYIKDKLKKIQENGYSWDQLPTAKGMKKVKTKWVKY